MQSLPLFMRLRGRPVLLVGTGDAADAKRRLLERAGAIVIADGDARLAIVALDDAAEIEAAVAALKARGVLVNAVDHPDLCDFTLPAIIDRDPVLVAIGTGGASAGLAKALRQRLETLLPATLGDLAKTLFAARGALRARFPDGGDRRRAIDAALAPGGALDPLASRHDFDGLLVASDVAPRTIAIRLMSADPDDLTLKQARLLGEADRLYVEGEVPEAILVRARADAGRFASPAPVDPGPGLTLVVSLG